MRALRLDPQIPLLWRTPDSLQFGLDRVTARLDRLDLADERMLHALSLGVTDAGLALIAAESGRPGAERALLRRVRRLLLPDVETAPPPRVAVHGTGVAAEAIARVLGSVPADARRDVDLAVLVADWVVSPADAGAWLRRDLPHLPVVLSDGIAAIGPLVVPGRTACLHCVHRARTDADPAWPAIATQLLDRAAPALDPLAVAAVAVAVGRMVRAAVAGEVPPGEVRDLDWRSGRVRRRAAGPHPECGCGAHPGSDWATDADRAAPWPTRSATTGAARA